AYVPKRGVRLFAKQSFNHFNETDNENFTNSEVSLEFYQTSRTLIPITLGIKGGAAHATGDVPFYELNTVGRTTGLHGYDRDRFSGNTSAYLDNQLTVEFGSVRTAVVPLTIGVFGFYDVGRVWIPDETSNTLHTGYGGGFYLKPLLDVLTTKFSIAFSEEEKSGLFEFGLGLKL
ncbi:MAG: BamA/TamA family outer membrane protein, partial [Chitinophagales bacterium]|nr:BamA/TamA family outer membrane protein [Chitinophagales bacterium]